MTSTLILRLDEEPLGGDRHRVRLRLEESGHAPHEAVAEVTVALSPRDAEDLRWYLEDYLQYPLDPAPAIAARIERRMEEIGDELFRALFQGSGDSRDLWAVLRDRLAEMRVEVASGVAESAALPWELLRDPKTGFRLALHADAFVRTQARSAIRPKLPALASDEPVRVLVAICRPKGNEDVPFRSVASRLVKGLTEESRQGVALDVLRPPTFEALSRRLREAKAESKPYHIVHFDGHGGYLDVTGKDGAVRSLLRSLRPLVLGSPRPGKHGYLLFENPDEEGNFELVG